MIVCENIDGFLFPAYVNIFTYILYIYLYIYEETTYIYIFMNFFFRFFVFRWYLSCLASSSCVFVFRWMIVCENIDVYSCIHVVLGLGSTDHVF